MDELTNLATDFLERNYKKPIHTVAAALRAASGKVYLGLNIDHFSGYVCAETSALASAMNSGEKGFTHIAAVRKEEDGSLGVANPCGKCRQIFHDYAPGIIVTVSEDGVTEEQPIEALLPYGFMRQRQKIQLALNDENAHEVVG